MPEDHIWPLSGPSAVLKVLQIHQEVKGMWKSLPVKCSIDTIWHYMLVLRVLTLELTIVTLVLRVLVLGLTVLTLVLTILTILALMSDGTDGTDGIDITEYWRYLAILGPTVWCVGSNKLLEWFVLYFGHGDDQPPKQPGEPSVRLLVEQWAKQTFAMLPGSEVHIAQNIMASDVSWNVSTFQTEDKLLQFFTELPVIGTECE